MSTFTGTRRAEIIAPFAISPTVVVDGADPLPAADDDLIFARGGKDTVAGGGGDDTAFLGSGNDLFTWLPGEGSDVVEGQGGVDTLGFAGSGADETIDVSANGERATFFRDVASITMDLNEVERIDFAALGGADSIFVNDLTGTDVNLLSIDLEGAPNSNTGDGLADQITANGTDGADRITVALNGGAIVVNGLAAQLRIENADAGLDQLIIEAGTGNDRIDASGLSAASILLAVNGGEGNDTVIGGAGADTLSGGEGDDRVLAGGGADLVFGDGGVDLLRGGAGDDTVDGGGGDDTALLNAGDDVFIWAPGDGSDRVEGQEGFDRLDFIGSGADEVIDISADGQRVQFLRDVAAIDMDLNDVERIDFLALGGADHIVVGDLTGTGVKQVELELEGATGSGTGDGLVDQVTVEGSAANDKITIAVDGTAIEVSGLPADVAIDHAEAGLDELLVTGGAGRDRIDAHTLPAASVELVLDGGDEDDVVVGSAGDDVLLGGDGDDVLIGGDGDDVLDGGDGEDVLDGGEGDDILLNGEIEIEGFLAGAGTEDRIDLRGVAGATSFAWVQAHTEDVNGNAVIDLGNGEQMTLRGVSAAELHFDDFVM
jgi:Ca2+-binding RTX toxin-like protein